MSAQKGKNGSRITMMYGIYFLLSRPDANNTMAGKVIKKYLRTNKINSVLRFKKTNLLKV